MVGTPPQSGGPDNDMSALVAIPQGITITTW